jgi:hypothetical protein
MGKIVSLDLPKEKLAAVYGAVTNAVSDDLIAPRTAIFCAAKELRVTEEFDDVFMGRVYICRGFVDSHNRGGALVRSDFRVSVDPKGGHSALVRDIKSR